MGTVDESLYAYFGRDMERDGVQINMPHKPHPYGLLDYLYAQRLPLSNQPITIDFEPRFIRNKPSPHHVILRLIRRVEQWVPHPIHTYADSAFSASTTIEELRGGKSQATIAINLSTSSGLQDIYRLLSQQLPRFSSRTVFSNNLVVQVYKNQNDHVTGIATTNWKPPNPLPPPPIHPVTYDSAVFLFNNESISSLVKLFKLPSTAPTDDPVRLMKDATGWDISLPPPNADGSYTISPKSLSDLFVSQLRLHLQQIHPQLSNSKKNKDEMIAAIVDYYSATYSPTLEEKRTFKTEIDINNYKNQFLSSNEEDSTLVDEYNRNYNLIDRINRTYYYLCDTSKHRDWRKLYFYSIFYIGVMNCYAFYSEHRLLVNEGQSNNNNNTNERTKPLSVGQYVYEVCKAIRNKYTRPS